jgi:hypothetical protein
VTSCGANTADIRSQPSLASTYILWTGVQSRQLDSSRTNPNDGAAIRSTLRRTRQVDQIFGESQDSSPGSDTLTSEIREAASACDCLSIRLPRFVPTFSMNKPNMALRHLIAHGILAASLFACGFFSSFAAADETAPKQAGKLYELRFYTTLPGKLPDLNARFRDHTMKLFEKHGMENIIYWTVSEGTKQDGSDKDNMLIYVIAHKDEAAKDASWKAFLNDPEWKSAAAKSEENGKILAKAPEAILMRDVAFSAADEPVNKDSDAPARLWELRQYNDGPERVPHTVDRFASGEDKIFTKHGMQTVKFWTATDDSAFIYLLAHMDRTAAKASWKGFMNDFPTFMAEYRASHPDALIGGGRGNDVRFLIPTDYSPRK